VRLSLSILDRYLVREFTGPFLVSVGGFALIAMVNILMYLVELTVSRGVSVAVTIRLLLYELPELMVMFFPMAVLFSVMLVLVRMAKDNELTVLRSSGVAVGRIVLPLLLLCGVASGVSLVVSEKVVPWTNRVSEELYRQEVSKRPPPEIMENVVFKGSDRRHFYVRSLNKVTQEMEGVLIFEETASLPRIVSAKSAVWRNSAWTLFDGYSVEMGPDGQIEFYNRFSEFTINVKEMIRSYFEDHKSAKEMSSKELKDRILLLSEGGLSTRELEVEYYLKRAMPVACVIFGVVGISFCLLFVRTGKDWWGVIVAICSAVLIVGFYFFMVAVCQAVAKNGGMSPMVGAWLPNMVYGGVGGSVMIFQLLRR
jgi:lipopolysaccharide export system permease protein